MKKRQFTALFTATEWWPLSARLAIRFLERGCKVAALCPRGHVLNAVSGIGKIYPYYRFDSMAGLEKALEAETPDLVVPCDDRAAWQLHDLHQRKPRYRELIESSLGPASQYSRLRSRVRLLDHAAGLGLRVPETVEVHAEPDIRAWFSGRSQPAVLKIDGTWGGNGVEVVHSAEEGLAAFKRLRRPLRRSLAWKRLLVNNDPIAFWSQSRLDAISVSLQEYIVGRPATLMLACWRGELLGLVSAEVLCTQGKTGASTIVRLVRNEEMAHAARRLVETLGLSGFHGLDFMLEEGTDAAYLIELNARCTQLGHLSLAGQGDLAGLLCHRLGFGGAESAGPLAAGEIVSFFPQALVWNPDSPYLRQAHMDIPVNEPKLVKELQRPLWPERQWSARLYGLLFPKERTARARTEEASPRSDSPMPQDSNGAPSSSGLGKAGNMTNRTPA